MLLHIVRIDQEATKSAKPIHGWQVRYARPRKTVQTKLFSDGKYNGERPALKRATTFAKEQALQLVSRYAGDIWSRHQAESF